MNSKTQRLAITMVAMVLASCASMNSGEGENSSGESEVADSQTLDQAGDNKSASNSEQDPFDDEKPQEVVAAPSPTPEPTPVIQEVTQAPPPAPINEAPTPEAAPQPPPQLAQQVPESAASERQKIVSVKYLNNKGGGVIQVRGSGPLRYTTRKNESQHQLVIEIADAQLTEKTKRPLDFRDMAGPFGSLDAYDSKESGGAHFVVQLREGAEWPEVTLEGSAILIMASNQMNAQSGESSPATSAAMTSVEESDSSALLLGSSNLKFTGKKISLETNDMDLRDALKFISEESGVNMIFSDGIQGKASLRLRQVPWDQALVILLQSKKLGYVRQGNVLRIATQAEIKAEEAEELKVLKDKNDSEPLKVRMYPISYAKVDDLSRSVQPFLSTRGKLVGDNRTNSLVVTDVSENLERIAQLIASLDIQPLQVLIEGKIVEAKEDFSRDIGIKWNFNGVDLPLGTSGRGPVNMRPSVSMSPPGFTGGALDFNLNIGTLDIFGNLGAALSISEAENRVKVISSPRILTLSNEQAQISQTTEVPIRTTTTVNSTTQSSFTFKPVNLKLDVTPQITADSAIIMKVAVSRQFLGANVGGASGDAQPVNSRDANTKVLVRNGETAVIGGIYTSDATEADAGVPWFKDIPFLGGLFRRTAETKNKSELIVFLTPRILEQAPAGKSEARLGSEGGGGSQ